MIFPTAGIFKCSDTFKLRKAKIGGGYIASLVAQMVKNLHAMQETQVQSMGWEDPLEKGMATHSSILAWRIPWAEEPGELQSMGSQRGRHDWVTKLSTGSLWDSQGALVVKNPPANAGDVRDVGWIPRSERSPRGGHRNPLQYSFMENSLKRGDWHATVHGVTKSWTQKWFSKHSG